jgi:hypothetical protein
MGKRAPRFGSKAWFEERNQDPEYIKGLIASLSQGAARGDRDAAENLAKWLADYPQYRSLVPQLRDLSEKVESIWIHMVSGADKVAGQATAEEVAKLKTDLLASVVGGGGILEKLMASTIAVNYLVHQHAAARLADKTEHLALAAYREHRMTAAQKRFHGAMKMWELLKEKKANGMSPPGSVAFFAEETEEQAGPNAESDESSNQPSPKPSRRTGSASRKQPTC